MKRIWLTALIPISVALAANAPPPAAERTCSSPPARASSVDHRPNGQAPGTCAILDSDKHVGRNVLAPAFSPDDIHRTPLATYNAVWLLLGLAGQTLGHQGARAGKPFIRGRPP